VVRFSAISLALTLSVSIRRAFRFRRGQGMDTIHHVFTHATTVFNEAECYHLSCNAVSTYANIVIYMP
jgi:hypothetical protein